MTPDTLRQNIELLMDGLTAGRTPDEKAEARMALCNLMVELEGGGFAEDDLKWALTQALSTFT